MANGHSVQLAAELETAIAREAKDRGRSLSEMTAELLEEGIRMRRVPGILFTDGPAGRRATVAGTGLDVWEIVATWESERRSFKKLRESYDWLTEAQLRAALEYRELYPAEIAERLERECRWTPERVEAELPFSQRSKH